MANFRHKEVDREFRRGLEELVLLGGGRAEGGCASEEADEAGAAGGGEGADQLARRRRRSDLEGDDLAETSAATRRHNRIFSRWAARQAEEMITNIERRNRESELMALARLHAVSMLDASFLRESRRAQSSSVERPVAARASSVLQRWRELEDESAARDQRRPAATAPASNNHRIAPGTRGPVLPRVTLDTVSESNESEYSQWPDGSSSPGSQGVDVADAGDRDSSREQSPDIGGDGGERESERVRQIVSGWMTEISLADSASQMLPGSVSPRSELLGERERERVRLVREWMHTVSQQRDARANRREERESLITNHENRQPQPRNLWRLRGRQARLDLIMRNVREREKELQELSEHQPVSRFAHRNRIQSVLRGRFLRNGALVEDVTSHSVAAREIGLLRQHHPVSVFREGLHSQDDGTSMGQVSRQSGDVNDIDASADDASPRQVLEVSDDILDQFQEGNITIEIDQTAEVDTTVPIESSTRDSNIDWRDSTIPEDNQVDHDAENEQSDWQPPTGVRHDDPAQDPTGEWQENVDRRWLHEAPEDDAQDGHLLEAHEHWQEDNPQATDTNWQDGPLDSLGSQHSFPDITNRFSSSDDDNVYSMELRELLSRRSVSNLLHSGFRESLDQLIQSYIERQGRDQFQWDMQQMSDNDLQEEGQSQQTNDLIQGHQDSGTRPLRAPPAPPPPPPPLWHPEFHHGWNRQSIQRSEAEWDVVNDLRTDMARLQQVMSHMQRMLDACMDMQLELQRAVRQEVSAALNHSVRDHGGESSIDGTKWSHVRKGMCCICCDKHIDSLLYRCGHMCTCSGCANELVQGGGKCPLCRAPIIEVIRAYSIM